MIGSGIYLRKCDYYTVSCDQYTNVLWELREIASAK